MRLSLGDTSIDYGDHSLGYTSIVHSGLKSTHSDSTSPPAQYCFEFEQKNSKKNTPLAFPKLDHGDGDTFIASVFAPFNCLKTNFRPHFRPSHQ